MSLETILLYLIGNRQAIQAIAADPWAPWVGLVFALSVGLVRAYDPSTSRALPWRLLLPFGFALVLSSGLFLIAWTATTRSALPSFLTAWWSFLGLLLMTAPLAWIHALPFQWFLDDEETVRACLLVGGLIALWRVVLMIRVLGILLGGGWPEVKAALFLVLLVADGVALLTLALASPRIKPDPTTPRFWEMVGGGSVSSGQGPASLTNVSGCIVMIGVLTLPIWLIGSIIAILSGEDWLRQLADQQPVGPPSLGVWVAAAGAVAAFLCLLPSTQRRRQLSSRIDRLMREGVIEVALKEMSDHLPQDFPRHWQPPPTADVQAAPSLLDVWKVVIEKPQAPWVRSAYLRQLEEYLRDPIRYWYYDTDLEKIANLLSRLPEGPALARQVQAAVQPIDQGVRRFSGGKELPVIPKPETKGQRQGIINMLWRLAEKGGP